MGTSTTPQETRAINSDAAEVTDVIGLPPPEGDKLRISSILGGAHDLAKSFFAALKADDKTLASQLEPEMVRALRTAGEQVDQTSHRMHDACRWANTALRELESAPGGVTNSFFSRIDEQVRDANQPRNEALSDFTRYDNDWTANLREVHLEGLCEFVRDAERALKVFGV